MIATLDQRITAAQAAAALLAAHEPYKKHWQGDTSFNNDTKKAIEEMLSIARGVSS